MPVADVSSSPCSFVFQDTEPPIKGVHFVMVSGVEFGPRYEDGRLHIMRARIARGAVSARETQGSAPFLGPGDVFGFLHNSGKFAPVLREFAEALQELALGPHWGL